MFELFVALFGGMYYGGKILGEQIEHKIAVKKSDELWARRDEWKAKVTNWELEKEIRFFIDCPENQDAVWNAISDVYHGIVDGRRFYELYPGLMDCRKKYGWSEETCESVMESIFREDEENAVRIMLAKQGYLAYMDASSGCCKSLRTNSRLETEIIIWCAEELKRHGVEEKFIPQEGSLYGIRTDEPGMGWEV